MCIRDRQYIELARWEGLTEVQIRQFQSVDPYMDDVTAQCALKDLSGYLYRYYEKKVIIQMCIRDRFKAVKNEEAQILNPLIKNTSAYNRNPCNVIANRFASYPTKILISG